MVELNLWFNINIVFKILYPGMVLHQDTRQDTTLDDLGVVNMDSILYCFTNSELPFKSLHKISTRHKYYTRWISVVNFFESLQRAVTINWPLVWFQTLLMNQIRFILAKSKLQTENLIQLKISDSGEFSDLLILARSDWLRAL